jgi:hypothetical protein
MMMGGDDGDLEVGALRQTLNFSQKGDLTGQNVLA